ncbi:MAG: tetratricopeptide repeat protein [Terracidiphilus sp.]
MAISACAQAPGAELAEANASLQAGEADKALALLEPIVQENANDDGAHNLECRVFLTEGELDAAVKECEKAVSLDPDNSNYRLWLGRALGEKAEHAAFLNAYSLAKRVRAEFAEAARLDPGNAEALASLGEFDCSAPGIVGGGLDKAEQVADQLEKVDPPRAHELRATIAEQRKDYAAAEQEFKRAIAVGPHPAYQWMALASFYRRRERWDDMVAAVRSGASAARRDKHAAVALYNGASTLVRANRELPLAMDLLEEYVASPNKNEEAPAFVAWARLARLKDQLGDQDAATRDMAQATALAHEYKPGTIPRH